MIDRRFALALTLLLAMPALAQPANPLAVALVTCWQARGVRFTPEQVAARIGTRTGRAALAAVAGSWIDTNDDDQEIMVEIVWEAGRPPLPAEPLLHRDLARGLPALLITTDGHSLLLHALDRASIAASDPLSGQRLILALSDIALIGRPLIAGA